MQFGKVTACQNTSLGYEQHVKTHLSCIVSCHHLLRLLAPRRPWRLAPLLMLLLTLRLRFLRLTGEGLDSEEVTALAFALPPFPEWLESEAAGFGFFPLATCALSSSLESEAAGLAAGLEPFFFTSELLESDAAGLLFVLGFGLSLGSLLESLAAGVLSRLGVPLLLDGAGLLILAGGCLFSFGPASSESEDDKAFLSGLSALTYMHGNCGEAPGIERPAWQKA